jgi:hypothetical protein
MARTYTWDAARQQYRDSRGRFVAQTAPQEEFAKSLARVNNRVRRLAAEYRNGTRTLASWRVEMQTIIKQVHAGGAALAHGGFANLTPTDVARLEENVTRDYLHLEAWVSDLRDGLAPTDGRMASRAQLYVNAGRTAYHDQRHEAVQAVGYDEVRSILHPAEHCEQCIEQYDLGWQPITAFVPVGSRECIANDKCTVEYRRSRAEGS